MSDILRVQIPLYRCLHAIEFVLWQFALPWRLNAYRQPIFLKIVLAVGRILAIANQKGGVGKTTTAVNLAASLAVAESRVLLIDADPQGNATSGCGLPRSGFNATTYDVLLGNATFDDAVIREVQFRQMDIMPATPDLAGAEVELVDDPERVLRMKQVLAPIRDRYDYILIDCPPSLTLITLNMLVAADAVLIPLQCEYFALEGLSQLLATIERVQESLNPELHVDSVLLTMFDNRLNLSRQVATDAREHFGDLVFETVIPRNIRLAEAPSFGKPIVVYDISSVGAQAYMAVARELLDRNNTSDTPIATPTAQTTPSPVNDTPSPTNKQSNESVDLSSNQPPDKTPNQTLGLPANQIPTDNAK